MSWFRVTRADLDSDRGVKLVEVEEEEVEVPGGSVEGRGYSRVRAYLEILWYAIVRANRKDKKASRKGRRKRIKAYVKTRWRKMVNLLRTYGEE